MLVSILTATAAWASNVSFEIALDKTTLSIGEGTRLSLIFNGDRSAPHPETPKIDGFSINYNGTSTRMSIVNGTASSSVTYNYFIVPTKTGDFKVGPFTHEYDGRSYTSNEITVHVVDNSGQPHANNPAAPEGQDAPKAINDRLYVTLKPSKTTVYANEIFTVRVKLYFRELSVTGVSLPDVADSGFSIGTFDKQPTQATEIIDGLVFNTAEFTATAFAPSQANSVKLGPATLKCNIMVKANRANLPGGAFDDDFFNNFFDSARAESVEVKSKTISMRVMPVPEEGKPQGFKGAIGTFDLDAAVQPPTVKTGDPVTLKMTVTGTGNLNSVTVPDIDGNNSALLKYYDPQIKQDKQSKTFEQAVIPLSNTVEAIPEIAFSYFDPEKKSYQTIKRGPFPIKVTGAAAVDSAKIIGPPQSAGETAHGETLGKDVVFIKERLGELTKISDARAPLYRRAPFIVLLILPPVIYALALIYARRTNRLRSDIRYARGLQAPKKARQGLKAAVNFMEMDKEEEFYNTVHKTIYDYLGNKLHIPPGEIMDDKIFLLLEERGLHTDTLKDIYQTCEMARYARGGLGRAEMQRTYSNLEEFISQMERVRV
ncbi:MAG: BatD family protein [Candidatus Magnetominusculus sp. LBB02]|nr:BatD family protein [Candidatus Magnetominusculus sp. LBB02]